MALTTTEDSGSVGTSEYSIPAKTTSGVPTSQSSGLPFILQVWLRIASIANGDQFEIKFYRTINSTQVLVETFYMDVNKPSLVLPSLLLGTTAGWDLTAKKLAGTDRTFHWTLEKLGV